MYCGSSLVCPYWKSHLSPATPRRYILRKSFVFRRTLNSRTTALLRPLTGSFPDLVADDSQAQQHPWLSNRPRSKWGANAKLSPEVVENLRHFKNLNLMKASGTGGSGGTTLGGVL